MSETYENLKKRVTDRYYKSYRYTIMNVFAVFISGLIAKNTRISDALTTGYITPLFGEVHRCFFRMTTYLIFSCLIAYFIRKEAENDGEIFNEVNQGLKIESTNAQHCFFREFASKFEGFEGAIIWACRDLPLLFFGLRILRTLMLILRETFEFPQLTGDLIVILGISLWYLWLYRTRTVPLKTLVRKKTELFGV